MKTINKVFLILLVSLASSPLFAQNDLPFGYRTPKVEINTFVKEVEGAGSLAGTVQAADGGYVTTSKIDDLSVLVRKIKASGQKQWERRLNFDVDAANAVNGITQTTDGGFVLAGDALVKLRPNGTLAWKKSFVVSGSFSSVIATPDGGVIAVGNLMFGDCETGCGGFVFAVRFTVTGDVVWGKSFENRNLFVFPYGISSTAIPNSGFIVAFQTSIDPNRLQFMKISNSGNVVWRKSLKPDSFDFQSLGVTGDGGVIFVGTDNISNKLKVVVLNADGTLNWNARYSLKVPGAIQSVSSPVRTPDGGYVLTGTTRSGNGFIAKIDSSRNVAFQNTFAASGESVFATPDGGFFLVGATSTDILVSKTNSEGIVLGCSFFHPLGTTTGTAFGPLKIGPVNIATSNDLSLESFNFGLTSVVTNHSVSTVCQ